MNTNKRVVLSSDHAAIALRQAIATHINTLGWEAVDIGPTTPESTPYGKLKRGLTELRKFSLSFASSAFFSSWRAASLKRSG